MFHVTVFTGMCEKPGHPQPPSVCAEISMTLQDELSEMEIRRGQPGTEQAADFLAVSHPPFRAVFPLGKALVGNMQCVGVFRSGLRADSFDGSISYAHLK